MSRLSVVVPVYNEVRTIDAILKRLSRSLVDFGETQVIVVDDGSSDGTATRLHAWADRPGFCVVSHQVNRGKGSAVRSGLQHARGRVVIVQDADLEYDPGEIPGLVEPILLGTAQVVFGSRYLRGRQPWSKFRLAVVALNLCSRLLYGQRLTDQATCYKAMPLELWRRLNLQSDRFELCSEITAKLGRLKVPILEMPIAYRPRTRAEGKKIRARDGFQAVWTLLKHRFRPMSQW
jgi:dolichol-phosphate mannosyltransferase